VIKPYEGNITRQRGNGRLRWKEAICPYCHEAFIFDDVDKIPPTCGRYGCLRKAFMAPSKEVQRCN